MKIGIVSDTHGLLRPEVIKALEGCEVILHGGDITGQNILEELGSIAPVYAVRGNGDKALTEQIARLYLTHPGVNADGIMTKMGY